MHMKDIDVKVVKKLKKVK